MQARRVQRYRYAVLIDRGLKPWEIARLTERQVEEFYFHPRDEHGVLKYPSAVLDEMSVRRIPAASYEEELKVLMDLDHQLRGEKGKGPGLLGLDKAIEDLKAVWADGSRVARRKAWEEKQKAVAPKVPNTNPAMWRPEPLKPPKDDEP
jgi:hypothetical protein